MSAAAPAWQLPLQLPRADAAAREARRRGLALRAAVVFALLALTVLDRFGLRIVSDYSVPPGLVAMYALVAAMAWGGAAELNRAGALAYLAAAAVVAVSFLVNAVLEPRPFASLSSLVLMLVLYAPFTVALRREAIDPALWRWTARLYVAAAVALAVAGIAQFFLQFAPHPAWLFDYAPLLPEPIRASGGWNTVYSTGEWVKSNGFFLREPSIFSVAMALALLCELSLGRRKAVLAVLALGLLLSYSGSGLLCLGVAMLFPLGWRSLPRLAACAALAAAVFFVFGEALNLSYTIDRIEEFNSQNTSAYCRFVYPGLAALEQFGAREWASLLGNGPGTMVRMGGTCADGHQPTYAKLLFEYGGIGALVFGALIIAAVNRSGAPVRLRAGLAVTWLLLGGNLAASELLLAIYLLSAMWPAGAARARP